MGPFTVDASVFLNAFNPYEKGHEDSHRFLARVQGRSGPGCCAHAFTPGGGRYDLAGGAGIRRWRGSLRVPSVGYPVLCLSRSIPPLPKRLWR
jgi:hypothetical protein